ncbi:2393_t:CDS:2 [Ambispora leptoticha]|uniref:2393_t:CDS:1 n=1 Tax=Ambispora leptoticha TaxID=144679 RepID=A0A9N9FFC3_9GLOM|nr:2393_t:CDS:2 [Ambispora leptoticha]
MWILIAKKAAIQFQSDEYHTEAQIIHKKWFDCGNFRTNFACCHSCETIWFKENYSNWTTGNLQLDSIIQKSQAEANISGDYLEYIPFEQFELVEFYKAGTFSEIYSAIWLEGLKWDWNEDIQAWSRGGPIKVALKKLKNSQNLSKHFLEKLRKYLHCLQSGSMADTFGITKDPEGSFIFVMRFCENGDFNQYIKNKDINWKDKIDLLWGIIDESISTSGRIADIGIHGPVDIPTDKSYGVLSYIAPEFMDHDWITDICDNPAPTEISEEFNDAEERRCEAFQIQKNISQEIHKDAFYTSRFFNFQQLKEKYGANT